MTPDQPPQWAIIELMGHVKYGGVVSKDNEFGTPMLRVEVPMNGEFITQFVNPSSIYRMTLCSEAIGRAAATAGDPKPMQQWEMRHLLPKPTEEQQTEGALAASNDDDGQHEDLEPIGGRDGEEDDDP